MKRVLVTGATGFVGANLVRRLLRDGHVVHLAVRPGYRPWRIAAIRDDLAVHEFQLYDGDAAARVVREVRPDWVFHLAVHGAYPSQTDWRRIVETNLVGTVTLAEACLAVGVEAFVNTGSSSEYGLKSRAPTEDELLEPNSPYAVTKASATMFVRHLAHTHGVRMPTLRLYSAYGPYEEPGRFIPALVVRGLEGELPPLAEPEIARDFVYVDDVVEAYLAAASTPTREIGPIYNVGTGIQTTLREAVETACRVLSISAPAAWGSMPRRQWDTTVWVADRRKIKADLGWQPRHSFESGLEATAAWFRAHEELRPLYAPAPVSHAPLHEGSASRK